METVIIVIGSFLLGYIVAAKINQVRLQKLQSAFFAERRRLCGQIETTQTMAASNAAEIDREYYRNHIALPDWEALFAPFYK